MTRTLSAELAHIRSADPLVLACMLAWRQLTNHGEDARQTFGFIVDPEEELTFSAWSKGVSGLRQFLSNETWVLEGLEKAPRGLQPGDLEQMRRALSLRVARALFAEEAGNPNELVAQEILAMATPRGFSPASPELVDLIVDTIRPEPEEVAYCAFEGAIPIALRLSTRCRVHLQLPNVELARIAMLLGLGVGGHLSVHLGDPMRSDEPDSSGCPQEVDVVVTLPPFGLKTGSQERETGGSPYVEVLQLTSLLPRGRKWGISVVSDGVLFRTTSGDQNVKRRLLREHGLSAIVSLPRGVFGALSGVNTSMIVMRCDLPRVQEVLFVDGRKLDETLRVGRASSADLQRLRALAELVREPHESEKSAVASLHVIEKNDMNLSADRYVLSPDLLFLQQLEAMGKTIPLGDLAEIVKPQSISVADLDDVALDIREVATGDVHDGTIQRPERLLGITEQTYATAKRAMLESGDILISVKGKIGVVGVVPDLHDELEKWLPSQSFVIVRIRRLSGAPDPEVLAAYLRSPLGQKLLNAMAGGTTVQLIPMNDLRRLPVMIFDAETQIKVKSHLQQSTMLKSQIANIQEKINWLQKAIWSDLLQGHSQDEF